MLNKTKENIEFFIIYVFPLILYASFIFFVSSYSEVLTIRGIFTSQPVPKGAWTGDEIEHIVEYGIFAFLALRMFNKTIYKEHAVKLAVLLAIFYGATDEIHQLFVLERTASLRDLFFDSVGALLIWVKNLF